MSETVAAPPAAGPAAGPRKAMLTLTCEWTISNIGYYGMLSILPVYFLHTLRLSPALSGLLVLLTSVSFRLNRILLASVVDKIPAHRATAMALAAGAAGFVGLALVRSTIAIALLIPVVGTGGSVNTLTVKVFAAALRRPAGAEGTPALVRFASLATGLNAAAAIGPLLASVLFLHGTAGPVFGLAALTYGSSSLLWLRLGRHPAVAAPSSAPRVRWLRSLTAQLTGRATRRVLFLATLGFVLYAPLYAVLPLFVRAGLHAPALAGTFFAANATLVIAGQLPVSRLLVWWGAGMPAIIAAGFACFGAGFTAIWLWPRIPVAFGAVAFWTLGEMLVMPSLDAWMAQVTPDRDRVSAFALIGGAMSVGDAVGAAAGVAIAGWLAERGRIQDIYGGFAALAVLACACALLLCRHD